MSRNSQVSSASTRTPIPKGPPTRNRTGGNRQTTRIRKSFSLNDMKQFLIETRKDDIGLVDSRSPVPVMQQITKVNLLKPLIQPQSITTPSISPSSSTKSLRNNEEDGSLASKMWLTPSILRSNPINFIRLGSLSTGLSIKETENPVII